MLKPISWPWILSPAVRRRDWAAAAKGCGGGRRAFPNIYANVEGVIVAGDNVVERFSSGGTHLGDFMGIPLFLVTGGANPDYLNLNPTPEPPRIFLPMMLKSD